MPLLGLGIVVTNKNRVNLPNSITSGPTSPVQSPNVVGDPSLKKALTSNLRGKVMFDDATRGQYSTDASVYQMTPVGVVLPADEDDIATCLEIARQHQLPVLPRGGGTSQNGQTVNQALVLDNTHGFDDLLELDVEKRIARVRPGMVLDTLNRLLKPHGLWFPVDVSTASRATIGGMCGNNSCGQRSLVYGTMRDNVVALDAMLADGERRHFGLIEDEPDKLQQQLLAIGARDADEIANRFPNVLRRVGGYNIDALVAGIQSAPSLRSALSLRSAPGPQTAKSANTPNLSHLLVGSEGTLAYTTAVELKLAPIPQHRVLGVCHFPGFYQAMDAAQHLVGLKPSAVELIDATMIELAREIEVFQPTIEQFVRGEPEALLVVEFAHETQAENLQALSRLAECMSDLGYNWNGQGLQWGGVLEAVSPKLQAAISEVRTSGLNIMMSMKTEGKPVSFVEDCAVDLPHLADYTNELTELFERYGTRGTWYAHASVGCLHVRPVLNLKLDQDVASMRELADQAFDLVLNYKGSHSGEHGDGISRSEFHPKMFGQTLVNTFAEIKQLFDPDGLFNPGKIVNPPRMNERHLLRFHQDYQQASVPVRLDWSDWPEAAHGLQGAVEMCNNNGACRKLKGGAMCPSYRVTRMENDVTRGRANTLRLALSGQLPGVKATQALESDALFDAMKLCVSCKACKRECPTGVDVARMKLEVLAARQAAGKHGLHERLVGFLPRYAPLFSRVPWLANLRNSLNTMSTLFAMPLQAVSGFSASRQLPQFASRAFSRELPATLAQLPSQASNAQPAGDVALPEVILWNDTFNEYFEPDVLRSAVRVLHCAGYKVSIAGQYSSGRPLCCGRTFLSVGRVDQARQEMQRTLDHLLPQLKNGAVLVGLEPSCLLTFRDELHSVLPGDEARLLSQSAFLFEEFLSREASQGRLQLPLRALQSPDLQSTASGQQHSTRVLLHGHCHQKAFSLMGSVTEVLNLIPELEVEVIESSCCGMAGSFGYHRDTADTSRKMAELDILPAMERAGRQCLLVADGTSCRHQISDLAGVPVLHVAQL